MFRPPQIPINPTTPFLTDNKIIIIGIRWIGLMDNGFNGMVRRSKQIWWNKLTNKEKETNLFIPLLWQQSDVISGAEVSSSHHISSSHQSGVLRERSELPIPLLNKGLKCTGVKFRVAFDLPDLYLPRSSCPPQHASSHPSNHAIPPPPSVLHPIPIYSHQKAFSPLFLSLDRRQNIF